MFVFHIAFSLTLIALLGGCFLYMKAAAHHKEAGAGFAKLIAVLVILVSLVSSVCISYCGIKLWQSGVFQNMMNMHQAMNKDMISKDVMTKHHK
ncbi:MAG: hypothetical protein SFW66_04760 [Gammaproteobacteria bacterium]|nr:hypothetical protein [Gammaproteobacteria bacterium]